jgi:hypothetical protein
VQLDRPVNLSSEGGHAARTRGRIDVNVDVSAPTVSVRLKSLSKRFTEHSR